MIKRRPFLKIYLLWTLTKRPKCGYEIKKEIEKRLFNQKVISNATIYSMLEELKKEDYLDKQSGSRNKILYITTKKGKKFLDIQKTEIRNWLLGLRSFLQDLLDTTFGDETK
ncbi:MAG: PadR family transcriptional regulator [Candidatus Methanofastidiosia archaeon]